MQSDASSCFWDNLYFLQGDNSLKYSFSLYTPVVYFYDYISFFHYLRHV
jgi:hypothetical protein